MAFFDHLFFRSGHGVYPLSQNRQLLYIQFYNMCLLENLFRQLMPYGISAIHLPLPLLKEGQGGIYFLKYDLQLDKSISENHKIDCLNPLL